MSLADALYDSIQEEGERDEIKAKVSRATEFQLYREKDEYSTFPLFFPSNPALAPPYSHPDLIPFLVYRTFAVQRIKRNLPKDYCGTNQIHRRFTDEVDYCTLWDGSIMLKENLSELTRYTQLFYKFPSYICEGYFDALREQAPLLSRRLFMLADGLYWDTEECRLRTDVPRL